VTSTDGTNNVIVWAVGSSGDQRLHGHNGDTGAVVYAGGGANELMTGTNGYNTAAIAARGRIYVANNNKVYAFSVPAGNPTPTPSPTPTPTATPIATPSPTPAATPSPTPGDAVEIFSAVYTNGNHLLKVHAGSSIKSSVRNAPTLRAYVTSTNDLIGTLNGDLDGSYIGSFSWPASPQMITVRSSMGGSADLAVVIGRDPH
jgi:hypothetical protein